MNGEGSKAAMKGVAWRLSRFAAVLIVLALANGVMVASGAKADPVQIAEQDSIRPIADHHVHLFSPMSVELFSPPPLPAIKLPADVAKVLAARNQFRTDQARLEKLYTSKATYLVKGTNGFVEGPVAVARYVKWTISDDPYKIVPVTFSRLGNAANINGYVMDDDNERFGFSELSLVKDSRGQWRIASETFIYQYPTPEQKPVTAADKIAELDALGIRVAAILSDAYYFDEAGAVVTANPYPKVRAENDWTADQVAHYPGRLFAFCSFNPLEKYALAELDRCASSGRFTGLKLHFNASQVYLRDPAQVAKVKAVFARANQHGLPIIIHLRTALVPGHPELNYGAADADIFLHQLVAAAPDIPIQVAHLWGGETYTPGALKVFAAAFVAHDPVTRNLYFDVSGVAHYASSESMPEIVALMRQIGMDRMLFGSDAPIAEAWEDFRKKVPLTDSEFRMIANNVAPYLRANAAR